MDQRRQQFSDLTHALRIMRRADNSTSTGNLVLKMYKLETGMLTFEEYEVVRAVKYNKTNKPPNLLSENYEDILFDS